MNELGGLFIVMNIRVLLVGVQLPLTDSQFILFVHVYNQK